MESFGFCEIFEPFPEIAPAKTVGIFKRARNLRIPARFSTHFEKESRIHDMILTMFPTAQKFQNASSKISIILQTADIGAPLMELALDNRENDGVFVFEIAINKSGAHVGLFRDIGHRGDMKPVLNKAFFSRIENPVSLDFRPIGRSLAPLIR